MTYQQTVLNSKPAGFWMITAPSGTTETDLSGNGKNATITEATDLIDRAYRPLVTGTTSDRAYRFFSQRHKLTYPALEMWEVNRDHIPFSIELTYQWIEGVREQVLFAPQEASATNAWNNGLFQQDGLLRFAVSDGLTKRAEASYQIEPGRTYHVVAVYGVSKIYLYLDGVLVADDVKPPGLTFRHTTANFISITQRGHLDPVADQFLLDAVSVYRRALTPIEINNHYVNSSPNISDLDLINSNGGKLIKANQEDMTAILDFSARARGWRTTPNILTDLTIDDDGNLSLKKIKAAELWGGSEYSGNLITANQASVETDTTGFVAVSNSTISRSTAQAAHGSASIMITSLAAGTASASMANGLTAAPVIPGETYTLYAEGLLGTVPAGTACLRIYNRYFDENGASWAGYNVLASANTGAVWTPLSATVVIPDQARYMVLAFATTTASAAGQTVYFDKLGIWRGSNTNWSPPTQQPRYTNQKINENGNILLYTSATADVDSTGMANTGGGAHNLTRDTAVMYSGTGSWKTVTSGSGTVSITPTPVTVKPGYKYTHMVKGLGTTTKTMNMYCNWYDASGTLIGNGGISGAALSTSAWTTVRRVVTAPPNAVRADLYIQVASVVAAESYWFDEVGLFEGDVATWSPPNFNNTEVVLLDSRVVVADQIGQFLGAGRGGIGGLFDLSATENDHVGEQVVASISNSARNNYFEIVKKSDKNLYLRYVYLNQNGTIATLEDSYGAISGLLGTQAYFYLEWSQTGATLYINNTSTSATIDFDAGLPQPQFDFDSFVVVGGGVERARTWNNNFRLVKLYDRIQPTENFDYNKTAVNGYTLKLEKNLSVSQLGTADIFIPTGSDGTEVINSTHIAYEPRNSSIVVKTSPDEVKNLLTYTQATLENGSTGWTGNVNCTVAKSASQAASGGASLAVTATALGAMSARSSPNTAIVGGRTYTANAKFRANTTGRTALLQLRYFNVGGSQTGSTFNSATITDTTSGWTDYTVSGQAPLDAVTASVYFHWTAAATAAGEIHFVDNIALVEGISTTYGEPLQIATHGSEVVLGQFPTTLPAAYYANVQLSTDDSWYNVEHLRDLQVKAFSPDTIYAENSFDELVSVGRGRVFNENLALVRQGINNGIFVDSSLNRFYIKKVQDSTTAIPDGGSSPSTAGPAGNIRTLEFWVRPETQGYYFFYDGTTEYSMRYYDAGGFTTTGFTTLYVDGVVQANTSTLSTWYNRWHHIVLTNASAQINIDSGAAAVENLLTPNQSTAGDTYSSVLGFTNHTGGTLAYDTVQKVSGAGSIKHTTADGFRHSTSTFASPTPVTPGKIYTASWQVRSGASPTGGYAWRISIEWMDEQNNVIKSSLVNDTVVQDVWKRFVVTDTAPAGAARAYVLAYRNNAGGVTPEEAWMDEFGFWEGADTTWVASEPRAWFGAPLVGGTQSRAKYQNISYYPQSFAAGDVTDSLAKYLGDATGGSITDSGIDRSVTDSANLMTLNQATIETDTAGWYQRDGAPTIVRSTAQKYSGDASLLVTSTANGLAAIGTAAIAGGFQGHNTMIAIPGQNYTSTVKARAVGTTRNISAYLLWYTSAGAFISAVSTQASVTSAGWVQINHTAVSPSNAAYVASGVGIQSSVIGDAFYFDELGIWQGAGTAWTKPLPGDNPKTFEDVWEIQAVPVA